jgi:hypothetical protein
MHKIVQLISKRFLWPTSASGLVIFDYFLFATGNPSITYSFLGGWFVITLLLAAIVTGFYGYGIASGRVRSRQFVLHVVALGIFSAALFVISPYARELAKTRLESMVVSFVEDPINTPADVAKDERHLMLEIRKQQHTMQYETLIPTFRRIDYRFVNAKTGEKYRLIMTMGWLGTPTFSLRRVEA